MNTLKSDTGDGINSVSSCPNDAMLTPPCSEVTHPDAASARTLTEDVSASTITAMTVARCLGQLLSESIATAGRPRRAS